MFIRKNNYENSLRRVKVEFGTLIGLEEDKEAFVTLKELDTMTTLKLKDVSQKGDQNEVMEFFKDILPRIIVVHNLYETETKMMSNEDVANFIYEKLDLTSKVISEYTKNMFRTKSDGTEANTLSGKDDIPESV